MTSLHNSLTDISKQYTVFVKDQVLTEQQLNSVSVYLDDQSRLTRTALTGVGIVNGLKVTFISDRLILSDGLGITGDGDLLINYQSLFCDRFKEYPVRAPEYAPFKSDNQRIPLFQFVAQGETDNEAKPLSGLPTELSKMVFILLAETVIQDKDICTGTSCDNGSRTYTNNTRLLATYAEHADALFKQFETTNLPLNKVQRCYLPQVTIEAQINTQTEWFAELRTVCAQGYTQLYDQFKMFRAYVLPGLNKLTDVGSASGWATKLSKIHNRSGTESSRLQYYYEFLGDLAQSWNELLDCLSEAEPGYLISAQKETKHLLLGGLNATGQRTGFYPAHPHTMQGLDEVVFLMEKITALISQFGFSNISTLKITPSSASEPCIPGYYQPDAFNHWLYQASQKGKNRYLLGYHADKNEPLGNADNPLQRRQNAYDLYRIEGVIGKTFKAAETTIKKQIRMYHLPFSVTGTLVEGSYLQVIKPLFKPAPGLKNFGYLLKKDLAGQLQDVTGFSQQFKNKVIEEADKENIREGDVADLRTLVSARDTEISRTAKNAISLLNKPNLSNEEQAAFNLNINTVIKTAGMFKNDVAKVSSTHFPTSFDQLIVNRTPIWVDWIDRIVIEQEKKETEKHLLPNFVNAYPGLEVTSGVPRGGTFVLLYNSTGTVIGCGSLPHYIEPVTEEAVQPELPKLEPLFPDIQVPGIKVIPSLDFSMDKKFVDFDKSVTQKIDKTVQLQPTYTNAFKDSLGIIRELYTAKSVSDNKLDTNLSSDERFAEALIERLSVLETQITETDKKINDSRLRTETARLTKEKAKAQTNLAESILTLAKHTSEESALTGSPVIEKAIKAIVARSGALAKNTAAINKVKTGVNRIKNTKVGKVLNTQLTERFREL